MEPIANYRHLERIKASVPPTNTDKLLTVNQARKILGKESKYVTKAMRDGVLDFFYIHTPDMDFFFILDNKKFAKMKKFNKGANFSYKLFKEFYDKKLI